MRALLILTAALAFHGILGVAFATGVVLFIRTVGGWLDGAGSELLGEPEPLRPTAPEVKA